MLQVRVQHSDEKAPIMIGKAIKKLMNQRNYEDVVVVCIGTDRSIGDSLGPLIGSHLEKAGVPVKGTLANPVHAINLVETMRGIHKRTLVIAVDACLGKLEHVGKIDVSKGLISPGKAVGKTLPDVGDISIFGMVNVGGFMEHMTLQSTRLNLVMDMADCIAKGIRKAVPKKLRVSWKEVAASGTQMH